jgi:hypothetical protein
MKKRFLLNATTVLAACALSMINSLTARAQQGPARLDYNVLYGNQTGAGGSFQIMAAPAGIDGPYMHFLTSDNNDPGQKGSINYIAGYSSNQVGVAHGFQTRASNGAWIRSMQILQNGRVNIGDQLPTTQTDYKLAVQGKLVTQSLYVTNPNTWADFVFEPSYEPMALPTLESYLKKNKHLPYIPSAKEIEANGYNVADMDAKLLQTIEELTLHLIELKKEVEQLKAEKLKADE